MTTIWHMRQSWHSTWGKFRAVALWTLLASCLAEPCRAYVGTDHEFQATVYPPMTGVARLADVSYNAILDRYLVVWQQEDVGGITNVYGQIFYKDGTPDSSQPFAIATTGESERNPKIASANNNYWLVVYATGTKILAKQISSSGVASPTAGWTLSDSNTGKDRDFPDVGGSDRNNQFMVVWEEYDTVVPYTKEVRARRCSAINGPQGSHFRLSGLTAPHCRKPSINQWASISPSGGDYFVAWQKEESASTVKIEGCYVAYDGSTPDGTFEIVTSGKNEEVSVAGGCGSYQWLVVWHLDRLTTPENYDVKYAFVASSYVENTGTIASSGSLEYRPSAVYVRNNDEYLVAYGKAASWTGNWNVNAKTIEYGGSPGTEETFADNGAVDASPEGTTIGGSFAQVAVTWDEDGNTYLGLQDWFVSNPETVYAPTSISGPSTTFAGKSESFTASGARSSLGHTLEYQFDWGDDTLSSWGSATRSYSWSATGTKTVKAKARCATHTDVESGWYGGKSVSVSYCTLSVAVSPSGTGSVAKNPNKTDFSYNETVALTASGSGAYVFNTWSGAYSGTQNPYTLTMDGNKSITANFVQETVSTPTGISVQKTAPLWGNPRTTREAGHPAVWDTLLNISSTGATGRCRPGAAWRRVTVGRRAIRTQSKPRRGVPHILRLSPLGREYSSRFPLRTAV